MPSTSRLDLSSGQGALETRAILRLATPLALAEVGLVGMTVVDTVMVGPLGAGAIAALGFASAYQLVVLGLFVGTVAGVTPLVARARGARDDALAGRFTVAAFVVAALCALPATALVAAGGAAVRLLGQPPDVTSGVAAYLPGLLWGIPAVLLFSAGRAALEGAGEPRPAMLITVGGLAANAMLNALLIPRHGLAGAAIATSIGRWLMLVALLTWMLRHGGRPRHITITTLRRCIAPARRIVSVGAPIGVHYGLELGVFGVAATLAGWLGAAALAAWHIAMSLAQAVFVVAYAVAQAGAIRLGRALGGRHRDGAALAIRTTYRLVAVFAALCALVLALAPETLGALYTEDPAVRGLLSPLIVAVAIFTIADQLQVCGLTLLHGAADTTASALIAVGGYWLIGLPLAWGLVRYTELGIDGLLVGLGAGVLAISAAAAVRLRGQASRLVPGL